MNIFLCLRNHQDWEKINIDKIWCKSNVFHDELTFLSNVKNWEKCIFPNYIDFRLSIKKIALSKWSLPYYIYDDDLIHKFNDEDIIVPIDDDDWLHPNFKEFIEENSKNYDFGFWDKLVNHTVGVFNLHSWYKHHSGMGSNNYFFRIGFLKKLSLEKVRKLIKDHCYVSKFVQVNRLKIMDKKEVIMSVYNQHPASYSVLKTIGHNDFISLFSKKENKEIPFCYEWTKEGINEVRNLVSSIAIKDYNYKEFKIF